jgi:hypothetical protein
MKINIAVVFVIFVILYIYVISRGQKNDNTENCTKNYKIQYINSDIDYHTESPKYQHTESPKYQHTESPKYQHTESPKYRHVDLLDDDEYYRQQMRLLNKFVN